MKDCKHGVILYGDNCLNCKREEELKKAASNPKTKMAELLKRAELARITMVAVF